MFEKIHFIEHNNSTLTQHNMQKFAASSDPDYLNSTIECAKEQASYKFAIDGRIRALFPSLNMNIDTDHYYYPQLFCWFECGPSYYTTRSDYQSYEIVFTYSGEGYLEYEGQSYTIGPGCGFFIDCRKPHSYKTNADFWEHSVLHFDGSIAKDLYKEYESYGDITFHDKLDGSFQCYLEVLLNIWDHFQIYKELQMSNTISDIITYLLLLKGMEQQSRNISETINYITKYIQHNFATPITLDFLASFANISKYHLTREFKKYLGTTPIQYLISTRMINAKFMLIHTRLPISMIAEQTGFTDINNFNRLFFKSVGMKPSEFRKQHKET